MKSTKKPFQQGGKQAPMGPLENLQLTWKLLRDPRVAPYAKMVLPILAIIYLISPIDLIPDVILGLGQIDDVGVIAFMGYMLVNYVRRAGFSTLHETASPRTHSRPASDDSIIDVSYRVVSEAGPKSNSQSNS